LEFEQNNSMKNVSSYFVRKVNYTYKIPL